MIAEPYALKHRERIKEQSPLFEIAHALVRLDHVASIIVNPNHSIV